MSVAVSAVIPVKDEAGNVAPLAREIAAAPKYGSCKWGH
jgi:hypothetical protein